MPELELGQAADKRPELVVLLGGEAGRSAGVTVLQAFILCEGRVELGCQESEEEVKEVNAESVGD